ncbi:TIGR02391 family protein [Nibrella viscosa]
MKSAIRNPTAHEPGIEWPINKQYCWDILTLISFLFRQLDKALYHKN